MESCVYLLARHLYLRVIQSTTMIRFVFVLLLAFILSPFSTQADVLVEGEVDIRVKVLNLADFPEFDFYIEYQDYY